MKDRAMQALYYMALAPVLETVCDGNAYGFRRERSTTDAVEMIYCSLALRNCARWVLEGDIKGCFDNISHEWLINNVPMDKSILKKWLKAGIVFKGEMSRTIKGTPQGGIISPSLAVLTLSGLEKLLKEKFKCRMVKGKTINPKVNIIVYADDFVITGESKELLQNEVMPVVEEFLKERGLELSREKTIITNINYGFDFLGQNVRRYGNKFIIKPSKYNVKAFLNKIRETLRVHLMTTQEELINILNPKIRGWANYHRYVVSKKVFAFVDDNIYRMLWKWMKRRHNNKGKKWLVEKYYHCIDGRKWVFAAKLNGKDEYVKLIKAYDTKIVRHIKIRQDANPYDAEWDTYFEEREGYKMFNSMSGYKKLKRMWLNQKGECPICKVKVTKETGWRLHQDAVSLKKFIVHPECHEEIHGSILQSSEPAD
jgi:RNA-directed DNA polymerase